MCEQRLSENDADNISKECFKFLDFIDDYLKSNVYDKPQTKEDKLFDLITIYSSSLVAMAYNCHKGCMSSKKDIIETLNLLHEESVRSIVNSLYIDQILNVLKDIKET